VLARLALATDDLTRAAAERDRLEALAQKHAAMRASVEREAEDLERQLKVAREVELPAPSGRASPEREKARWAASESLLEEARLLCGAARLVSESAPGLTDAVAALAELEKRRAARASGKTSAPIDESARARAACLSSLTRARRPSASRVQDDADALLAELSNAAAETKQLSPAPSRDERGVVVTLPESTTFHDDELTPEAKQALSDLGRVAASHPRFALQVVVHDDRARPSSSGDARARAVADALVAAGAPKERVRVENAGTRVRIVDPASKDRARNARVEVVFVPLGAS
jgi:outer membrane protein OmpA-like peptidoglycan-associated protein